MEILWLLGFILLLGLILAQWFVLYQLVKQRGRLLLRLDAIEKQLQEIDHLRNPKLNLHDSLNTYTGTAEVPVGSMFNFQLTDLAGRLVESKDFRDERVLLVFLNSPTEACKQLAFDLASLQKDFRNSKSRLVMLSSQAHEFNQRLFQELGLESPALLRTAESELKSFQNGEMVSAYLLDEEGRVVYPRAIGTDQVLQLAREAVRIPDKTNESRWRSLHDSRIERDGLKAGTQAPSFSLPTIYGETISLEEYRGRWVLLVFTSPHCAPCDYLAPYLVQLQKLNYDGKMAMLMIGRGTPDENRQKAEIHGFQFPVALQKQWEISRLYGIFSTPVAFLINEEGVIERNVAKGTDEILSLIQECFVVQQEVTHEPAI